MAKYSTGSGGGNDSDTCELCGAADAELRTATVAGATLQVCSDCVEHDDAAAKRGDEGGRDGTEAARNAARLHDAAAANPDWEEGADYDDDQLPYLVTDYADRVTGARQEAGYQIGELAEELGVPEADLLALEQGRATQAGVGGSTVRAVEKALDVELVEE